jgi:hypothetical protein
MHTVTQTSDAYVRGRKSTHDVVPSCRVAVLIVMKGLKVGGSLSRVSNTRLRYLLLEASFLQKHQMFKRGLLWAGWEFTVQRSDCVFRTRAGRRNKEKVDNKLSAHLQIHHWRGRLQPGCAPRGPSSTGVLTQTPWAASDRPVSRCTQKFVL